MTGNVIYSDTFYAMGVHCDVVLPGLDAERARSVIQRVKEEVETVEREISRENVLSFIHKTDRSPKNQWIKVSADFFQILSLCSDFYVMSNGAFDITVGPLCRQLKAEGNPTREQLEAARSHCSFEKVELDPEQFRFRFLEEEMELDFSVVEKAYALDVLKSVMADEEIENCIVSFDEEAILSLGNHPSGDPWPIGIRNVREPNEFLHVFEISDGAGITAGTVFIRDDGRGMQKRVIISPEDGRAIPGERTVSVKAQSASLAAFLAHVWLILPESDKTLLADQISNIEIFEAEYLDDDIRTKLTLNYGKEEEEE